MEPTTNVERRAAQTLVVTIEQMVEQLLTTARSDDRGWVRPLALLSAEIEYSAVRRAEIDLFNLADECRELSNLLAGVLEGSDEFALHYRFAMGASPRIRALHEQALAACGAVVTQHALVGWAA